MGDARTVFLASLRAGLRGADTTEIDDIISDYAAHFVRGALESRSDEEVARALGDPLALADELKVEMRIERWEIKRSPRSALSVIGGVIALGVVNTVLLLIAAPIVALLGFFAVTSAASLFALGLYLPFSQLSVLKSSGILASLLISVGSIATSIAIASLAMLAVIGGVNALGRYVRLHYRVLEKPSGE